MRVPVEVTIGESEQGMCLTCTRCGEQVLTTGVSERARNFGFVQLKEQCPMGERNFYVSEGDEDE